MEQTNPSGNKMIDYLKRNVTKANLIGMIIGAVLGYLYYRNVGCSTGSCGLTSNPFMMILWGTAVGYLVGDYFNKKKKDKVEEEN